MNTNGQVLYRGYEINNFFGGFEVLTGTGSMKRCVGLFSPDVSLTTVKREIDKALEENPPLENVSA